MLSNPECGNMLPSRLLLRVEGPVYHGETWERQIPSSRLGLES